MVVYFIHDHFRGGLALCSIGGQLIIPVWGRVAGRHHPALCCCQESFTPSSASPNGTSESIKTIITASPESKGIILGCQGKHISGVWSYLLKDLLDMHLARQPIMALIFCICVVWMQCWLQQSCLADPALWSLLAGFSCCLVRTRNLCLCWMGLRPYQQSCFYSHHSLMNHSQHPLNISMVRTSIVPPKGQ